MDKNTFTKLSYGMYAICTKDNGRFCGCIANSAMQITSEPATIAVSINHDNYTNEQIKMIDRYSRLQETVDIIEQYAEQNFSEEDEMEI